MNNKLKYLLLLLPLFAGCYYWTISRHDGIFIDYDKAQYDRIGEKTYNLFIAKPKASNIIKGQNRDSVLSLLKNPRNWEKYNKFEWINNVFKLIDDGTIVDYRKYNFSILDTSIVDIESIEHIVFKKSGLGQIKFIIKKNGNTKIIAKKGKTILEREIEVKDSIVFTKKFPDTIWKETIIGPIWF